MAKELDQIPTISEGDIDEVISVNYTRHLRSGETLTGTPTVVEVSHAADKYSEEATSTDLDLRSKAVNKAEYLCDETKVDVEVGHAVQFTIRDQNTGRYRIRITVATSNSRTIERDILIDVE